MKQCKATGCTNNVWSGGLCRGHQYLNEEKANERRKNLVEKFLKRREEKIIKEREEKKLMWAVFEQVWEENPHYCYSCDKWLGETLFSYHVDHIIEKQKRKDLLLEKKNMVLVCLDCHSNKTLGKVNEKYKNLIETTKKLFNEI